VHPPAELLAASASRVWFADAGSGWEAESVLTGAIDIYVNNPIVIIGSTAWPELDWGEGPAGADGRHVAVRTRGQVALTRVSVWTTTMPVVGEVVFDGELDLNDYTIVVGDLERLTRWTHRIGQTGRQRVVVRVDDPGRASRVHVGLNIGSQLRSVPSTGGPTLFDVQTSRPGDLPGPNERALVRDGHDSPYARLSAAIALLPPADPTRPWSEPYEVGLIVEWLRWFGMNLTLANAQLLGDELAEHANREREASPESAVTPAAAGRIAAKILHRIDQLDSDRGPHD
jgi:hypothetical protein